MPGTRGVPGIPGSRLYPAGYTRARAHTGPGYTRVTRVPALSRYTWVYTCSGFLLDTLGGSGGRTSVPKQRGRRANPDCDSGFICADLVASGFSAFNYAVDFLNTGPGPGGAGLHSAGVLQGQDHTMTRTTEPCLRTVHSIWESRVPQGPKAGGPGMGPLGSWGRSRPLSTLHMFGSPQVRLWDRGRVCTQCVHSTQYLGEPSPAGSGGPRGPEGSGGCIPLVLGVGVVFGDFKPLVRLR